MKYLTLEEVLVLHEYQLEKFGGGLGIRDVRLLESAILRPQTTFDGNDLYKTVYEKAAVIAISIIKNHPFIDGNKRTGLHAALTFLGINGIKTSFSNEDLVTLGVDIARGSSDILKVTRRFKEVSKISG